MVTERDFLEMEALLQLNEKSRASLKVGCLPCTVGKQPSIPVINLGKKKDVKLMMMMMMMMMMKINDDDDASALNKLDYWALFVLGFAWKSPYICAVRVNLVG